jgi:hypothetical protein
LLQALRVAEPVDEFVLRGNTDASLELFDPGSRTGGQEGQDGSEQEREEDR